MKRMNEKVPRRSAGKRLTGRMHVAFLAFIWVFFCVAQTAYAADNFQHGNQTWSDNNPPTIPAFRAAPYASTDNATRLITISGNPSGTLVIPTQVNVTIRGTVTGYNSQMILHLGSDATVLWEANLSGQMNNYDNTRSILRAITFSPNGSLFEVTGSIVSEGRTSALSVDDIPLIISGNGEVRNPGVKPAGDYIDNYSAIYSYSPITVKDNAQVISTGGGSAIVQNRGYVTVSGGLVFGEGSAIEGAFGSNSVIQLLQNAGVSHTGGTIIGYNKAAGHTTQFAGSTRDIPKLPAGATAIWAKQGSQAGISWSNGGASGFIPIDGVTLENVAPTVVSVTPAGTGISRSGNIAVTFSEAMDTEATGTVQLNSLAALEPGVWSNGNTTYTAQYRRLEANTAYTVKLSGFTDLAGNAMSAVTGGYTFTTDNAPLPSVEVLNSNDNGAGSLREALANALDGDVIDLSNIAGGTISLLSTLNITKSVTINGYSVKLDGGGSRGIMQIGSAGVSDPHPSVSLSRLHFYNGRSSSGNGGAILNYGADLTVQSCIFSNNVSVGYNYSGGGIRTRWGNARVSGCTFYNNSAARGGAIGMDNSQGTGTTVTITLTGNVFYNNTATYDSGTFGHVVYENYSAVSTSTVISGGYNITDRDKASGNYNFTFDGAGDTEDATLRFNTTTFRPTGTQMNIVPSGVSGFPATDFYGTTRVFPSGTAGAVQRSTDNTAPALSAGTVNRTGNTEATIGFTTSEAGMAYYLVVNSGESAPAKDAVKAGNSLGSVSAGAVSSKAVTLTAGAKDIYVVVEDAAGNISNPLKIAAAAYVAPDTTPCTVSSVAPSGTGAAISGNVIITFDEPMDVTAGTVNLNSLTALTGGGWSSGNTVYTIPYSGLAYSTAYTVNISGFKDAAGNVMVADNSNSFTAEAAPPTPVTATSISGVISPVANATPGTSINSGTDFTASLSWNPGDATFKSSTVYTATITLTATTGYTFSGGFTKTSDIAGFTVNGITPVWVSNNGATLVFTVTFPATAIAYIVTSAANDGAGSLRAAITSVNSGSGGGDVIDVNLSEGSVIALTTALPQITKSFTLNGNGVTIDGSGITTGNDSRILDIDGGSSVTATVSRVHFRNGKAVNYGAAIRLSNATLTLQSCIFSGNQTTDGNARGGAIYTFGNLTVCGCTFYNNRSGDRGGAIFQYNKTLKITGSLFYDNKATSGASVSRSGGTVPSEGYNVYDDTDFFNGTGDTKNTSPPLNTTTFRPTGTQMNIVASGISDFPATDFYGAARVFPNGTAGAVQYFDNTAPTLSAGTVSRTSHTEATIGFTTGEAGTAYYLVVNSGATAPTKADVKTADNSLGSVSSGAVSNKSVTLTAGARDIYVVVEDAAGNLSEPLKIEAAAYVAPPVALTGTATIDNMNPRIGDALTGSLASGNNTGTLSYQWKVDGTNAGTGNSYTVQTADLGKTVTLEITSDVETGTLTSTATAAVLKKAAPPAPSAPTLASKTHNSVTLTANALYGFSKDGATWQTDNVFTGLNPNTAYTFYQRVAETGDTEASAASPALNETTDAAPDVTPPTVLSVLPSGTDMAVSGNIILTFSEAMDAATAGTVQLNSLPALTGGSWSVSNTVYTVPYPGLSFSTAYTVNISGFKDAAGNAMTADNSHSFTTVAATVQTITVTSAADAGAGTLRQAITDLNAGIGGTITFDASLAGQTITLASTLPPITESTIIEGDGVTVSGNNACKIMYINASGITVTIRRVHFKNGKDTDFGGAIRNSYATLNLQSCIFSGNSTTTSEAWGGAIYNSNTGVMNIQGCTFYNNSTSYYGGAIYINTGTVILIGNIFYGNTAASGGDIIYRGSSGTVTSDGYNVYNGTSYNFDFNGAGDAPTVVQPFDAAMFILLSGGAADGILPTPLSTLAGYPTEDFYGDPINNGGNAGAVQVTITTVGSLIDGVTAPVYGATPVTAVTETAQYTGTVSWSPTVSGTFAASTAYTATITLTPKTGYTLTGVAEDFFTVTGATSVSNSENSGMITAIFPATDATINIAAIDGVTAPVYGATPVTAILETAQYTGTVTWSPTVSGTFSAGTIYTATITLTPKTGYTLTGVAADFFTVAGATTVNNPANSGVITAVFPATAPVYTISIGTFVNGSVSPDKTVAAQGETVTLTVTPDPGYVPDVISAHKTGDTGTPVETQCIASLPPPTTYTYTFTMPAYSVTVTATFRNPDREAVDAAKGLIEGGSYTVAQATANTEATVKTWLAAQINALAGMNATGITVMAANITITSITPAVTGTAGNLSGTNGSFDFTVSFAKGISNETAIRNGTITSTPYVSAQTPVITARPQPAYCYTGSTPAALTVTASVTDGGTLSFQWYRNTTNSNTGGTAIAGATDASFTPPTEVAGITYYYVTVTNTNTAVNGSQTATATSATAAVTVVDPPIMCQIILPQVNGVTTSPPAGTYHVESHHDFIFTLTLAVPSATAPAVHAIYIPDGNDSGLETEVTPSAAPGSYTVRVRRVTRSPLQIVIELPDDTGTGTLPASAARVWSAAGHLHIVSPVAGEARVYSATGMLIKIIRYEAGETVRVPLPKGFHAVVLSGGKTWKVLTGD